MVAGVQVMAFRRALLRRIQTAPLGRTASTATVDGVLPIAGLRARQFAVVASNEGFASQQTALQRLTEASKPSWRLRAAVKDVEASLPSDRGKKFYNRRLVEALEASDLNRAWAIVETLHRRHPDKAVLWPYTYNLLLRHYCKQQKTLMNANLTRILALLDVMVAQGSADQTSFQVAMAACSRARHLRSARHVMEKMVECGREPDARIYGFLINCCARKKGLVKMAEQYFERMMCDGVAPTILAVNAMLRVYSRDCERSKVMLDLVERSQDEFGLVPNTVTTRTVVHYLLCEGDVNAAVKFLRNVEKAFPLEESIELPVRRQGLSFFEWCTEDQKVDPGAATYYSLFRLFTTFMELPESSDINNMLDEDEDQELTGGEEMKMFAWITEFITTTCRDAPLGSLDIGVFNNAFAYYHRLGELDECFALFNLMKKRGIQPDETTLGLMFATCASQQQFEVGLKFLDHIITVDGYKPTLKVLSGAMRLCANSKNPSGALELFRAIEALGAFSPTVETYEPLVFAYARVGNVSSAWDIANEMEEKLGRVSVSIYNRILLACAEAALPGRALEVLDVIRRKGGVTADIISYNTALEAFVRAGERAAWWRTNRVNWKEEDDDVDYDEDEDDGDQQTDELHGGIEDKNEDLSQTTEDLTMGAVPPQDYKCEQREKAAWVRASIIELLEEMKQNRLKPDMTTYERAIAACSVNDDFEGVITIFDTLINRKRDKKSAELKSDLVSDSSFAAYLVACTSLEDKDRVVEVPTLLHKWHTATGQLPPAFVVNQLLDSLDEVGEWRRAVRMLPDMQAAFGVPPSVNVFNRVMQMCNHAGEHQLVAPIFATMQGASAYRVYPDAESYIQRIYAEEQRENWVAATDLFVEMQKKCPSEEISHHLLQKIALGRYRMRQNER
ncbi:hypothetical protein PF006_g5249 [Phytophthora fragariae]|uniref:PROP1-like PPR domain-containing protein n=1 Tax=Phytophthora fragariae TaxID=53985 RepID=A0A6A3UHP5_9STRA|nr:hypothetical protein PF006_g5249 [Phytophthora fragariae]